MAPGHGKCTMFRSFIGGISMRYFLAVLLTSVMASVPAAAQQGGTLVSSDPAADAPPAMQAWRIRYWTRNQDGVKQEVTGIVVAPREAAPPRGRRVIAWTHGTWGVAGKCSLSSKPEFFTQSPALDRMIAQGYVVVAPDYPGLGSSMPHPYLIGKDTAYSVLDAVRAARAIPGAAAGSKFAVWGESQGGHAALWTAMEARGYAPDLQLVGAAAGAPPTDLAANLRQASDANSRAMLVAFTLHSWSERFGYSLSSFTNGLTQAAIHALGKDNCVELGINPNLGLILGTLAVRQAVEAKDVTKLEPFASTMRANSANARRIPGPLLISQGTKDTLVDPAVTRSFAKAVCRAGKRVRWIEIPGGEHIDAVRKVPDETLDWIGSRFAGRAAPNDCRSI